MSPCLHFTWLSPCLHFHKAPVISIEYRWVVHQSEHELVIRDSKQGVRSKENRERERERESDELYDIPVSPPLFYRTSKCALSGERGRKKKGKEKSDLLLNEGDGRQRGGAPVRLCEPDWDVTTSTDTDGEKETKWGGKKESGEKRRWRGRLEAWLRMLS